MSPQQTLYAPYRKWSWSKIKRHTESLTRPATGGSLRKKLFCVTLRSGRLQCIPLRVRSSRLGSLRERSSIPRFIGGCGRLPSSLVDDLLHRLGCRGLCRCRDCPPGWTGYNLLCRLGRRGCGGAHHARKEALVDFLVIGRRIVLRGLLRRRPQAWPRRPFVDGRAMPLKASGRGRLRSPASSR